MAGELTVLDLVHNGSLTPEMAATLWAAMDDRQSFIVAAGPRQAGKSTMMEAVLDFLPADVPRHQLSGDADEMRALAASPDGGYLVVSEFSDHTPRYLRGEQVVQVFDTAALGYSIAGTVHADTPEQLFAELRSHGPIPDDALERIGWAVFLHVSGPPERPERRAAGLWEMDGVSHGAPRGRVLCRWEASAGGFVWEHDTRRLPGRESAIAERAKRLRDFAAAGRTGRDDLAALLAA